MEWLRKLLESAQIQDGKLDIDALMGQVSTEFPKHAVPKEKYNELSTAKTELDGQLKERDKQLAKLKDVDPEKLQEEITRLQGENTKAKTDFDNQLKATRLEYALETRLIKEGAVNTKAVKALLDSSKISLDGDNLVGIDDQLSALKESEKWAFSVDNTQTQTQTTTVTTGQNHTQTGGAVASSLQEEIKNKLYGN